ncbi:hypothetical protein [Tenuibacillus multivorans]|uniref:Uncharacterized protein n=1 Tax=Tenuibacillus multivorans TaxID=237069 RepID=A0A1H0BQ79_9BACI|nr:hypothetical protein [Tenuibacillus multivorans]GEL77076.1 hypothetical protein TMU01_13110 [Tenuibacillus multivorans]SDN47774.1 hypothetical protein SAMN05216498_2345 [Tenuibacillus multivorans]
MSETKKIIGENVKSYLEAKGIKHSWVIERLGVSKGAFYNFLRGEGNVDQYEQKILKLFRIKDPFYFHREEMALPNSISEKNKEQNFMDFAALSFHGADSEEFKEGMKAFRDIVELIDVLKPLANQSVVLEDDSFDQ